MKPIRVLLTYPDKPALLANIVDHLTTLGKSYGAPHITIADPDEAD